MYRITVGLILLILNTSLGAVDRRVVRATIVAIEQVESQGNTRVVNQQALGCLQITPVVVYECNRILGYTKYTLADRTSRAKSYAMAFIVLEYYGNIREAATGKVTVRFLANVWRRGYKTAKFLPLRTDYANRVYNLVLFYRC